MSKQPAKIRGYRALIISVFPECEITIPKLYSYYLEARFERGLGRPAHGEGEAAFRSWMEGKSVPGGDELPFVCQAMNARLEELGKPPKMPPVAYPDVVIQPEDDGLESTTEGSQEGGNLIPLIRSKAA